MVAEIFRKDCPQTDDDEEKFLLKLLNTGPEKIFLEQSQMTGQSEALQQDCLQAIAEGLIDAIVSKEGQATRS